MEDKLLKKMEDNLKNKIKWKTTSKKNGRRPKTNTKWETTYKKIKNGRRPKKIIERRPQAQFKKSTLIGCDIIVN